MTRPAMRPAAVVCVLLVLSLGWTAALAGEDAPEYDRVSLSASASEQVENDTLVALLFEQREGEDPAALAGQVNRAVARGVERAKQVEGVDVRTLGYQTSPVYRDQRLSAWRVRQSVRLESRAAARLSALVGDLQSDLQVESVSYSVSDERRTEAEERLMRGAIQAFSRRAALVAEALGRPDYRLVRMEIDTGGEAPRPMEMRMFSAARAAPASPPTLEAGTRTLEVTIRGTVELEPSQ